MDKYDKLVQEILARAALRAPEQAHFRIPELSRTFGVHDADVQETLTTLHSHNLIKLAAWDGTTERSMEDWADPTQVFHSPADPDNVRVKILVAGQRRLVDLQAAASSADPQLQVFISHIVQEKPVALKLKEYLQKAYGKELPVFVSSDQTSIGGGRKWFDHIISNLRVSKIIIILVSQESARREWINFEGGFGDGVGATVIPVAIKDFSLGKLGFPLAGYNGREIGNIEGILLDITRETGLVADAIDTLQYREDVKVAEASLIYKSLIVEPYWNGQAIRFRITNNGNTDIELLMFEAWVPLAVCELRTNLGHAPSLLEYREESLENRKYRYCIYTTTYSPNGHGIVALRHVLTPSMGTISPDYPVFRLALPLPGGLDDANIHYQIHARNYDTQRETIPLMSVVKV